MHKKTLSLVLSCALAGTMVPVTAFAAGETTDNWMDIAMGVVQDGDKLSDPEGDRLTGARANSWRFTKGYADDEVSAAAGTFGFDTMGAWGDLGAGDLDISATWTKANGINTYTVRKTPTGTSTTVKVPGSLAVGIDVSAHNNAPGGGPAKAIDWQKVKEEGVSFAIIRCGYGSNYSYQDDKWFASNYQGAKDAGLKVGVYLYSYAPKATGTAPSATDEAKHVLRILENNNIEPSDLALPVYLDLEDASQEKLKKGTLGAIAKEFCAQMQKAGYKVGIYANQYWFNTVLKNDDPVFDAATMQKNGWSRWVARYSNTSSSEVEGTDVWQFTCVGKVEGIPKKYCDVNFAYVDFAAPNTATPVAPVAPAAPSTSPTTTQTPATSSPTPVTYKIAYQLNKGKNNAVNPTRSSGTVTLKKPTRSGYTFGGWYLDKKFKKKVTKLTAAAAPKGKVTVYARWYKNYKITYKLNGGTNNKSNPKKYGGVLTLKNPTRTGYTFAGWYTNKKLTKKATKLTVTKNRTVYAKWVKMKKGSYVVTSNDGLFIRGKASTTAPILGGLSYNQQVRVVKVSKGWGQLSTGGWINLSYTKRV